MTVWFIDTSVLDYIIPVSGWSKDEVRKAELVELMAKRTRLSDTFVLPITAVVETGNHICQVKDGAQRRKAAEKLDEILRMVIDGSAPWVLDDVDWDAKFLREFLDGASSGSSWIDLATQGRGGMGGGDLALLVERDQYVARTGIDSDHVRVWTLDGGLEAHS